MNSRAKRKLTWVAFRDAFLFFFGIAGITYQTVTGNESLPLLLTFIASTGAPALINSIAMLLRGSAIELPPSPSAVPDSPTSDSSTGSPDTSS